MKTMTKLAILGANGQIAKWVIHMLAEKEGVDLTLFLRNPKKLSDDPPKSAKFVKGDVLDLERLSNVVSGQNIIYANLTGDDLDHQAKSIVDAMAAHAVKRLVFVTSLGIYDEVPGRFGEWNRLEI